MLLLVFQLAHQISCGRLKLASAKLVAAVLVQFLLLGHTNHTLTGFQDLAHDLRVA